MGKSHFGICVLAGALLFLGGCAKDRDQVASGRGTPVADVACAPHPGSEMVCTEINSEIVVQRPLYCYRTLGTVDCYSEPNPYLNEHSPRVRKVPPLASLGAVYVSPSEYRRLKTEAMKEGE